MRRWRRRLKRRRSRRAQRVNPSALKRAARKYRQFWSVPPQRVKTLPDAQGIPKVLVSLGRSPGLTIADGPKHRHTTLKRIRLPAGATLATTPNGKRLFVLTGKAGRGRKFLGYAARCEYTPTKEIERAGSHKKNTLWVHDHSERGGEWPKVYRDSGGNLIWSGGTYKVGKWIEH